MKNRVYNLVEKGEHGYRINRIFDYFILSLILLSVFSIILESIPEIEKEYGDWLNYFDVFAVIVFTIEYGLRIYIADIIFPAKNKFRSILKFMFSFYGIIDLLAILPFYLPMLIAMDLRYLRILRLTRILRVLKINRYNNSLSLIWVVIKEKKPELVVTGFVTFLILIIASFLMYYIEGEAQPEQFPNILSAIWWAVATLTTVGYGDIYPVTGLGKLISGLIAILGIGIVALPTGLISSGFIDKVQKDKRSKKKCPHCGKIIDEH